MTTTELIDLLKSVEYGASGRPREISIYHDENKVLDREDLLVINSTGDGVAGAELTLDIAVMNKKSRQYDELLQKMQQLEAEKLCKLSKTNFMIKTYREAQRYYPTTPADALPWNDKEDQSMFGIDPDTGLRLEDTF